MADLPNDMEHKSEKVPPSMHAQVKQQVMDRIKIFEDVIKEHESAREKALDQIKEQLKEAQDDLKYLNDRNPNA